MASRRRLRRKSCEGKRQYKTIQEAQYVAYIASRKSGQRIQAYWCDFGKHAHIGHPPGSSRFTAWRNTA